MVHEKCRHEKARIILLVLYAITGMVENILNWGGGVKGDGGTYKRAPETLTCRRSGDICKVIILCILFLSK